MSYHLKALASAVRGQAAIERSNTAHSRYAIVRSVDPNSYSVKVELQPDSVLTGWIPVKSQWVGSGWGLASLPTVNQLVVVDPIEGFNDAWVVSGYLYNDSERPPTSAVGEVRLVHENGSYLRLTNDGKVGINGQAEVDVGGPTINIQATGNVAVNAGGTASVTAPSIQLGAAGQSLLAFVTSAFMSLFNNHTHPEHDGGSTSPPNQQMTSAHVTSTVKGG
ncbi:hypothetical protein WK07_04610 [Burkholderia multivorans]|uniref:hypothetical protein n=1 Tax=Burkholderia multivorans TaxID=87883 RepID=UPI00075E7439|nr:hypothetical protein [Burkholderia multivorans]KVQ85578.1 hypothetical protein WK07_04610 [Burkholderia multivorans]